MALAGCGGRLSERPSDSSRHGLHEVTPTEDLMFEHGLIVRLLLIYNEAVRRIEVDDGISPELIFRVANLIRMFSEDYHEKNEEQYVFPRLKQADLHGELVDTLRIQHDRGRTLTDHIRFMAHQQPVDFKALTKAMQAYNFMYVAHISRENSVIFRAFHRLLPEHEYMELGETFEQQENKHLAGKGFEGILSEVIDLEVKLDIHDLNIYTPVH